MGRKKSRYPKVRGRTYIADLIDYLSENDWVRAMNVVDKVATSSICLVTAREILKKTEVHRIDVSCGFTGMCHPNPPRIDLHTYIMNTPGHEDELNNTLFHEIAHMIDRFACDGKGHGQSWKRVFREFGFTEITRCHSLGQLKGAVGKPRQRTVYEYRCKGCGRQWLSSKQVYAPMCWHHRRCPGGEKGYEFVRSYKKDA